MGLGWGLGLRLRPLNPKPLNPKLGWCFEPGARLGAGSRWGDWRGLGLEPIIGLGLDGGFVVSGFKKFKFQRHAISLNFCVEFRVYGLGHGVKHAGFRFRVSGIRASASRPNPRY